MTQKHETNLDYTGHDAEVAYHAHAEVGARPPHKHGINSRGQAIERWHALAEFFGYEPRIADLPCYMERD